MNVVFFHESGWKEFAFNTNLHKSIAYAIPKTLFKRQSSNKSKLHGIKVQRNDQDGAQPPARAAFFSFVKKGMKPGVGGAFPGWTGVTRVDESQHGQPGLGGNITGLVTEWVEFGTCENKSMILIGWKWFSLMCYTWYMYDTCERKLANFRLDARFHHEKRIIFSIFSISQPLPGSPVRVGMANPGPAPDPGWRLEKGCKRVGELRKMWWRSMLEMTDVIPVIWEKNIGFPSLQVYMTSGRPRCSP